MTSKRWSKEEPATQEIQKICDAVKGQVNEKGDLYIAFSFRKEIIAGIDMVYEIKVYLGDAKGVDLIVTKPVIGDPLPDFIVESQKPFSLVYAHI